MKVHLWLSWWKVNSNDYVDFHNLLDAIFQLIGFPSLEVTTSSNSALNIGDQQTLECNISVVSFLIAEPALQWMDAAGSILASTTGQSLTHIVNVEKTSSAGLYTCRAVVDVAAISLSVTEQSNTSLTVQSKI